MKLICYVFFQTTQFDAYTELMILDIRDFTVEHTMACWMRHIAPQAKASFWIRNLINIGSCYLYRCTHTSLGAGMMFDYCTTALLYYSTALSKT